MPDEEFIEYANDLYFSGKTATPGYSGPREGGYAVRLVTAAN